jgi:hypothetical protein
MLTVWLGLATGMLTTTVVARAASVALALMIVEAAPAPTMFTALVIDGRSKV